MLKDLKLRAILATIAQFFAVNIFFFRVVGENVMSWFKGRSYYKILVMTDMVVFKKIPEDIIKSEDFQKIQAAVKKLEKEEKGRK